MKSLSHQGSFAVRNGKILLFVSGLAVACTGCTNPKAVQTFAGMAPDPSLAQGLTRIYTAQPAWRDAVGRSINSKSFPKAPDKTAERTEQSKGIIALDTGIREYMKALGALAADSVVESSASVQDLTSGLTAVKKALPLLKFTDADITFVGKFIQALADLAKGAYQSAKLAELIGDHDAALQRALDIQIEIVNRGILPSIAEYERTTISVQPFLRTQPNTVHYLYDRVLAADQENAKIQQAAAHAYATALQKIKIAHTALYNDRNNVLTKEMFDRIKGPAQDAYKAFEAYKSALAVSRAK